MPTPCSVCAHLERATIDRYLASQVVNLSALERQTGLGRDALRNHRAKHLPDFLPSLTAESLAPSAALIHGEYKRLYDVALDALAAAQAGVLVSVGEDGAETRRVSSTAVARGIDTARRVLGDMAHLALDGPTPPPASEEGDKAIAQRLAKALDRMEQRQLGASTHDDATSGTLTHSPEGTPPTPGPGAGSGPPGVGVGGGSISPATPTESLPDRISGQGDESDGPATPLATVDVEGEEVDPSLVEDRWAKFRWQGSPAASPEERRAAGHIEPPPAGSQPRPDVDPDPRSAFRP